MVVLVAELDALALLVIEVLVEVEVYPELFFQVLLPALRDRLSPALVFKVLEVVRVLLDSLGKCFFLLLAFFFVPVLTDLYKGLAFPVQLLTEFVAILVVVLGLPSQPFFFLASLEVFGRPIFSLG